MPQSPRCGEKVLQLLKAIAHSQPIPGDDSQLRASSVCHYAAAKELGRVGWTDAPHREKISLETGELGKELKL